MDRVQPDDPLRIRWWQSITTGASYRVATSLDPSAAAAALAREAERARAGFALEPGGFRIQILRGRRRRAPAADAVGAVAPSGSGAIVRGTIRPHPFAVVLTGIAAPVLGMLGVLLVAAMTWAAISGDLTWGGAAPGFAAGGVLLAFSWRSVAWLASTGRQACAILEGALGAPLRVDRLGTLPPPPQSR